MFFNGYLADRLQKCDLKREREQHCGGECCSAVEAGWLGQAGQWCRWD